MITAELIEEWWPLRGAMIGKLLKQSGDRIVGEFTSHEGRYIYKITPSNRSFADATRDLRTLAYLHSAGFEHAPQLLLTRDREACREVNGQAVYILEYVEGDEPTGSVSDWEQLGKVTAQLHALALGPVETSFTQAATIPDLLEHSSQFSFQDAYDSLLRSLPDIEQLPKSIIHTDIGLSNVMKTFDDRFVFVDWDDAGNGVRVLDIAFPLINAFYTYQDGLFQETKAQAFYTAYAETVRLTEQEKKVLFDTSLFFALMYIEFGDTDQKWKHLQRVIAERESVEQKLFEWLK